MSRRNPRIDYAPSTGQDDMDAWLDRLVAQLNQDQPGSVNITGSRGQHPDDIPGSPNVADDEFEGASLDTAGTRTTGATAWAWYNQGGATATLTQGHLVLEAPADAGFDWRIIRQALPAAPWVYRYKMTQVSTVDVSDFLGFGLGIMNNTNARIIAFTKDYNAGWDLSIDRYSDVTTFNAVIKNTDNFWSDWDVYYPVYFEVESDGTTLTFRYSASGVNGTFITFGTETLATYITTADYICLMAANSNSDACKLVVEWFRRMS